MGAVALPSHFEGRKNIQDWNPIQPPGTVGCLWVKSSSLNELKRYLQGYDNMTDKLNNESIDGWLSSRKGWKRKEGTLTKEFRFTSFRDSIVFVNRIAGLADELDHHPDIHVSHSIVNLTLTTHSANGLTDKDLVLAERVDFATSTR